MNGKSTYRLLIQSEEKSRNVFEVAVFALFALSALAAIWQFAEEPALPTYQIGMQIEQDCGAGFPS